MLHLILLRTAGQVQACRFFISARSVDPPHSETDSILGIANKPLALSTPNAEAMRHTTGEIALFSIFCILILGIVLLFYVPKG